MLDPQLAFIQVPLQLAEQLPAVVGVVVPEVDPSALHVAVHPVPEEVVLLHAEEPHVPVAVVANPAQVVYIESLLLLQKPLQDGSEDILKASQVLLHP